MILSRKFMTVLFLGVSVISLSACEGIVHEPSHISEKRVQVEEEDVFKTIPVKDMTEQRIKAMSVHHHKYGKDAIDLTVVYDPAVGSGSAMSASQELARITQDFRRNGVAIQVADIMPVKNQGSEMGVLISYGAISALAPDDCDLMPGLANRNLEPSEDFEFGCTTETLFAKQIARPKDLVGNDSSVQSADGQRASNVVQGYLAGVPNEALDGESASE